MSPPGGSFAAPEWAIEAPEDFSVEIVKGGVVVCEEGLSGRRCVVLGRQGDAVDWPQYHESISRRHAALVYGPCPGEDLAEKQGRGAGVSCEDGPALHVVDLNSTHGTFVNKTRLPSNRFQRLWGGDTLRLGASSRLLVIRAPKGQERPEYDSTNLQRLRALSEQKAAARKQQKRRDEGGRNEEQDSGISWGFAEDAVEENEGESGVDTDEDVDDLPDYLKTEAAKEKLRRRKVGSKLSETDIAEKDRKDFETLQRRRAAMENLYVEIDRILAKEGSQGDLTAGQHAQIERNRTRIEQIKLQIEGIERKIMDKNKQRGKGLLPSTQQQGQKGAAEEHDDFFDRAPTSKTRESKAEVRARRFGSKRPLAAAAALGGARGGMALTYEEIVQKQNEIERELEGLAEKREKLRQRVNMPTASTGSKAEDSLDQFMVGALETCISEQETIIRNRVETLEAELVTLNNLASIAKPALPELRSAPEPVARDKIDAGENLSNRSRMGEGDVPAASTPPGTRDNDDWETSHPKIIEQREINASDIDREHQRIAKRRKPAGIGPQRGPQFQELQPETTWKPPANQQGVDISLY